MTADPQLIEQARSADPDARQKAAYLVAQESRGEGRMRVGLSTALEIALSSRQSK